MDRILKDTEGRVRFNVILRALIPFTLNAGLMKPRRGFTLIEAKEKLGVGKSPDLIDKKAELYY